MRAHRGAGGGRNAARALPVVRGALVGREHSGSRRPRTRLRAAVDRACRASQIVAAARYPRPLRGRRGRRSRRAARRDRAHPVSRRVPPRRWRRSSVRHVHRRLAPLRKVVVVDCDNTLWRGVVGEVGAEGVEFDDGHRALHETLDPPHRRAACWCACAARTKRPTSGACSRRGPTWRSRREHVVAAMINWQPKSQNLRTLAARLNLGLDSFVFIDDNPVECAEVRAGCPEVLTLQWPQRARRAPCGCCGTSGSSTAARRPRRTRGARQLYQEEFQRQELRVADADLRRLHREPRSSRSTSRR